MDETNKPNETGVTENNYASMLSEAINQKDAELRAVKEAQARQIKELTNMIVNQRPAEVQEEQTVIHSPEEITQLRKDLFTGEVDLNNLEYVKRMVELRDAVLETKGVDIFVAPSKQFQPSQEDYWRAEETAKAYKECIDYAQGDNEIFTTELNRRMKA